MSISTLFLTGFEHGAALSAGSGLFDTVSSGCTVDTTSPRSGSYRGHMVAPGAAICMFSKNIAGSPTKLVVRFGLKVSSRPASAATRIFSISCAVGRAHVRVDQNGQLSVLAGGAGSVVTGPTIDTASWHLIELQFDCSANPQKLDWKVDGVSQTQATNPQAATTITSCNLGTVDTSGQAMTADFDDWIFGTYTVAATDWYGDGFVLAQLAGADGTHSTVGDFSPGDAGAAYSGTVTTAYTMVDDPPATAGWTATRSTTDNLAQRITGTAYLEIAPAAGVGVGALANAVRAIMSQSSSGSGANTAALIVRNSDAVETSVLGSTGTPATWNGTTSNQFAAAIVAAPAGGWTPANVNALLFRFGWSNDIAPIPTVQALLLEVDWQHIAAQQTASDSVTVSDTADRILALLHAAADTVTVSDASTDQIAQPRASGDTVTLSDAATQLQGHGRTDNDTVTLSDAAVRALVLAHASADSVSVTDSANPLTTTARTSSGNVPSISDSASRGAYGPARAAGDTVTPADSAGVALGPFSRFSIDTVGVGDSVTRFRIFTRTATESALTVADSVLRALQTSRGSSAAVTVSDAATLGVGSRTRSASDVVVMSDGSAQNPAVRAAADTVTISDASLRVKASFDTVTITDAIVRAAYGRARAAADAVTVTDADSTQRHLVRNALDNVLLGDAASTTHQFRSADDTLSSGGTWPSPVLYPSPTTYPSAPVFGFQDFAIAKFGSTKLSGDAVSVGDAATRAIYARARATGDTVTVTDTSSRATGRTKSAADSVAVTDTAARGGAPGRSSAGTVTLSDASIRGPLGFARTSSASVALTDNSVAFAPGGHVSVDSLGLLTDIAVRSLFALPRSAADSVSITDAVASLPVNARFATDSVTLADAAARTYAPVRTAIDTLVIATDLVSVRAALLRAIGDTVSVSDAPVATRGIPRAAADSLALSDASARDVASKARVATDGMLYADQAVQRFGVTRFSTDTIVITEAANVTGVTRRSSDTVIVSDALALIGAYLKSAQDAVVLLDAAGRIVGRARGSSDTVTLADLATRRAGGVRGSSDTLTIADAVIRSRSGPRSAHDTVTISDANGRILHLFKAASDTVTITESATRAGQIVRHSSDTLTIGADGATRGLLTMTRTVHDVVLVSDLGLWGFVSNRFTGDTVLISDMSGPQGVRRRSAADSVTAADAAARTHAGTTARSFDFVTVADEARRIAHSGKAATDAAPTISDSAVTRLAAWQRRSSDTLTLSDVATEGISGVTIGVHDTIGLSDGSTYRHGSARSVHDTLTVADATVGYIPVPVVYGRVTTGVASGEGLDGIVPLRF